MAISTEPATASVQDTVRVALRVVLPTLAGGVIKRRPLGMAAAQKLQFDRTAVRLLGRLRSQYGPGPLRLRVPGRTIDLALSGEDVGEVLAAAPVPFSPSTKEKRAALGHFQPHGVLISDAVERAPRRRFNEDVLEPGKPLHDLAAPFAAAIAEEASSLWDGGTLDWDTFNVAWWRMVRRVTLGESAAGDDGLTDALARLRKDANWAYAHPRRDRLHDQFRTRLIGHLERAEPGSLAEAIASAGPSGSGRSTSSPTRSPTGSSRSTPPGSSLSARSRCWPPTRTRGNVPTRRSRPPTRPRPANSRICARVPSNRCGCGRPRPRCCARARPRPPGDPRGPRC